MNRYRECSALNSEKDAVFMNMAIAKAEEAMLKGELPVGAVVVRDGEVIAAAHNLTEEGGCALRHAEMEAMTAACHKLGTKTLDGCTLYVTLEPCPMCAGGIFLARPERVVFGAADAEYGAFGGRFDLFELYGLQGRRPAVTGGVLAEKSSLMVREFFENKRKDAAE
ncbi:MAG: nucleoside deaminase [Oscillospiraceae bacterium]|nr:nucleoside deaminase [Oscillospiraceae bacterium]